MMNWLLEEALREDHAYEDMTSIACVGEDVWAVGEIVLKKPGCIAGLKFLPEIFRTRDAQIGCHIRIEEGAQCRAGAVLAEIEGPARALLSVERIALNLLQHLSGIATLTALCVAKVEGTGCKILDTRKTLPGYRTLQKYAVERGGGVNHRLHLADRMLIKNNHLALVPLEECLKRARSIAPMGWIEVEIASPKELEAAIECGANAILLDNMTPGKVRDCVLLNKKRVFLEASGGIDLHNLLAYAQTGVDAISIGALTHSAPALDISLRLKKGTTK